MPAMAATGKYCASGAKNSMISSKNTAENTEAKGVLAPEAKFSPLRLNDPLDA